MADESQSVPVEQPFPPTPEELLTEQFYAWEKRGRGWHLSSYPVELEPPFLPFAFHHLPAAPTADDARKPTFLSTLADKIRARFMPRPPASAWEVPVGSEPLDLAPPEFSAPQALVEFGVTLPPEVKITNHMSEQLLLSLTYCEYPLGFELIGQKNSIALQWVSSDEDRPQLRQQLAAFFPEARISERKDFLRTRWRESQDQESVIVDFGLSHEFMRPLRAYERFDTDPLIAVGGALSELEDGELGVLQVLLQRACYPWAESIVRAVTDWEGGPFFTDAPEMLALAKEKISRPLFASVIRVAARSRRHGRPWEIARLLGGALAQFSNPLGNELIPLSNEAYTEANHVHDLLLRQTHRTGMLINSAELISLVHLPAASLRIAKLREEEKRTKAAPRIATGHKLLLGKNVHQGESTEVSLSAEHRIRHTYVLGASGTGKSTLLLNMIIQDIRNGEGLGVLDPHGDLVDQILGYVPEERFEDVILLDPSDEAYPIGFNILSAHSELEKNLLGSDLVAVFRRLSTSWGDQMGSVLANAILALLESDRGGTLTDLRRFLVEPEFRNAFLMTVRDPEVVYYWQKEFPLLKGKPQAPILTRLDTFLRPKLIRYMVAQKENRLDFRKIMDEKKIFLAKLAQGAIGEVNAYLLGALLVAKFHQLAMGRQEIAVSERANFYLYIDEFQNFVTPSMASILSGARKYRLGLILAHQELRQLWTRDTEVASAVVSNPSTRICFRLGDFDAKKLAEGFSFFDAEDLQNLGIGEAICRVERAEYDFNLKTLPLPQVEIEMAKRRREQLIALSRERYSRPREEVQAELAGELPVAPPTTVSRGEQPDRPHPRVTAPPRVAVRTQQEAARPEQPQAPLLGRGGSQHKYLQELIKRWAEHKGYRATIEKKILDGLGSVDVALEKDSRSIACEISVASTPEQELGNVRKCLAAGFEQVVLVSSERKTLGKAREFVSAALTEDENKRVQFLAPEELFAFIETLDAKAAEKEDTVRGYKVKVQYRPLGEDEKKTRRQAISQVILQAIKRFKSGS